MEFPYIKKYLGEKWLSSEIKNLKSGKWIRVLDYKEYVEFGFKILSRIDELICKLEKINGFEKWAKEASLSKSFKDCLFEIMIFEHLYNKADFMEIKPSTNGPTPEAFIVKNGEKLLIEVKRLDGISPNIRRKVSGLFTKIRRQLGSSPGIAFIGCPEFFYNLGEKLVPKKEFIQLILEVERRLLNPKSDKSIKAVFLVNINMVINPIMKEVFPYKYFFLVRRPESAGGLNENKVREILEVDGLIEVPEDFFHSGIS